MEPKPNNGTLRLPLKPIGLHSDEPTSASVDDPPIEDPGAGEQGNPESDNVDSDKVPDGTTSETDAASEEELDDFWSYMKAKMKTAMDWAHGVVQSIAGSDKPSDDTHAPE